MSLTLPLRRLLDAPGFALGVLLTVALVVTVNASAFAGWWALKYKPLAFAQAERWAELRIDLRDIDFQVGDAEALVFGRRAGMDWGQMLEIVNNSVVASPLINTKMEMLKNRDFAPAATVAEVAKVMDMALDTGRTFDIPMPITAMVRQLYGCMKASGRSELDYFALVTMMEELAGIRG